MADSHDDGIADALWASAPPDVADRLVANVNALLLDEGQAIGRLLDWVGVAAMTPLRERVLILCAEYLSRTGQMSFEEALVRGCGRWLASMRERSEVRAEQLAAARNISIEEARSEITAALSAVSNQDTKANS